MAFANSAYAAYQNTGIKTASQGKLVVLLYEGAIKNLKNALECFNSAEKVEARNIEKFGNYLMKTQDIISELQVSLNMDKGGQIASNLMSLYVYFNQELTSANITKDKAKIEYILKMITELHTAWSSASSSEANTRRYSAGSGLNIQG